jgi:hypothetical protein
MDMDEGWSDDLPWIGQYILDENGNAVRAEGLLSWAKWMEDHRAALHLAENKIGNARVSTIFLGLDYEHLAGIPLPIDYKPTLWETMVFGGPYNRFMVRYTSKEDALEGHGNIVQMLTS